MHWIFDVFRKQMDKIILTHIKSFGKISMLVQYCIFEVEIIATYTTTVSNYEQRKKKLIFLNIIRVIDCACV